MNKQLFCVARSCIILACALTGGAPTMAAALKTDLANSSVAAVFKQMSVPVEARFTKFAATIEFNPGAPDTAKASVEIDVASLDLGDPDMNREVAKKEWFNAAQFPKAAFVSSSIKPVGAGKFTVTGKLTIKGKTGEVSFPMSVKASGAKQIFEGALPIRRLGYNIGEGDWKDTSTVGDEIIIKFRVSAG